MLASSHYSHNTFVRAFQGFPLPVHWAGWSSDTHRLDRMGWKVMAEEALDVYTNQIQVRMGLRAPDNKIAISGRLLFPVEALYGGVREAGPDILHHYFERGLDFQFYTANDTVRTFGPEIDFNGMNKMRPIDPYAPCDVSLESLGRDLKLGTLKLFQDAPVAEANQIFIPMNSVDECLNRILELQYPEQQEIKKGLIMPEKKPLIQAQIFTLAA